MITYSEYLRLCQSGNSEERGQAAHFAASAFISHNGPADEQAALYAAVINFLDDPSVKVRAALAYALLHAAHAPRPVMLALLQDAPIIARAVAQFSPVLLDADLVPLTVDADVSVVRAIAARSQLGRLTAEAIIRHGDQDAIFTVLGRTEPELNTSVFEALVRQAEQNAPLRGLLLARDDLAGNLRLELVGQVRDALAGVRIVKGAIAPARLARMLRDLTDTATTQVGEIQSRDDDGAFAQKQIAEGKLSARLLLHALINGHVSYFAAAISQLASMPIDKVFAILEFGNRPVLNALLVRGGLSDAVGTMMARLVQHARSSDLTDDVAARYFIVTVLIEELIAAHPMGIPDHLTEIFSYLNDQNIILARQAARGVVHAFAQENEPDLALPVPEIPEQLALTAA